MNTVKTPASELARAERAGALSLGEIWPLAALMAAALALRLFKLGDMGYWHDEVITTFAARAPALETFGSITANDTHPPLYHILLHFWGRLVGYELIPLRLFSVLLGVLCLPAVYALGRVTVGPRAGLVAAGLMAVSPFQIYHGQQIRMYSLLTLVVLLAALACFTAWSKGGAWRWALFGLVAAAGLYTHVYFAFSLLGLNLWALYESARLRRLERRAWAGLILAQVGAVALFSPFLRTMLSLTGEIVSDFWIREVTVADWLFALVAALNYSTRLNNEAPIWYLLLLYLPTAAVLVLSARFIVGEIRRGAPGSAGLRMLLIAVVTPGIVATALSLAIRPILLDRSLIGVSGPFFILLATAAVRTWRLAVTRALSAAVALTIAAGLAATYPSAPAPHTLQPALETIFAERRPGDAVILLDWQSFDLAALRHPDAADVYVGGPAENIGYWQRRMAFMRWHTPDQVGPPERYAGRYRRVWVSLTPYTYNKAWDATGPWLERNGRLLQDRAIGEARVMLFELQP